VTHETELVVYRCGTSELGYMGLHGLDRFDVWPVRCANYHYGCGLINLTGSYDKGVTVLVQSELFQLPELDRKKTQAAVEAALEKYRIFRTITFDEREAGITAGYNERFHGPTNVTSDQTAQIAVHNVDVPAMRRSYCERIEKAVKRLPIIEQKIIHARYMEDDYVFDYQVYRIVLGISEMTYMKRRWKAFYKLALTLDIAVEKG
jgi:ArpU family phage transcriptional regulator